MESVLVRRVLFLFGGVAFSLLPFFGLDAHAAWAAVTAPPPQNEPVRIAPHHAVYKMKLASAKNGSNVSDVSGRMIFEWNDVCDGWTIQQRLQMHFNYADGSDQQIDSTELTWEAKDGKKYNFYVRRSADDEEFESYRGKAVQNADGTVSVSYSAPEEKTVELPAATIFPSAHTNLILQSASKDEKFFSRRVFDGSDSSGSSDISAFILPQHAAEREPALKPKLKKDPLLAGAAWPVHLAFFKIGTETGEPDYEMDINLLPNGVARAMKIDYGDFSVVGKLEDIRPLQTQSCP